MDRTERAIFTNMCMVTDGVGNVLIQQRPGPDWPGAAFPGGHVEPGESFTGAVVREVREETGLTITEPVLCGIKDWTREDGARYTVLLYRAGRFTGTLAPSEEGPVRWVPLSDLASLRLAQGMEDTLRVFLDDTVSELWFQNTGGQWSGTLK